MNNFKFFCTAASIFLFVFSAQAQSGRLTPENLWKLGRVSMDDVSPDGKSVIYGITRYQVEENSGNRDLFILPVKGGQERKVTAFEGNEFNARWRPDGERIGFLSGESGSVQLWEMHPDGHDKRQVTEIEGGITGFEYSPSGEYILFTADVKLDETPQEKYPDLPQAEARIIDDLMYRHWDEWHDYAYSHIFVAEYEDGKLTTEPRDIMKDEPYDAPLNPFGGMEQISWHPNGYMLAYTCKKLTGKDYAVSTNSDIYLYDYHAETTTNVSKANPGYDMEPAFSPDGKYLAWNSMARDGFEADRNRIMVYDLTTTVITEATPGLDQDANHPQWADDSKTLYFMSDIRATKQLCSIKMDGSDYEQITEGRHNVVAFAMADGGAVVARQSMSAPTELFTVDLGNGKFKELTRTNEPILRNITMGEVREQMVTTTDGQEMLVWVILPPGFDDTKEYPAILYCQGGPQSAVSQFFSYRWNFQLMAANDYVIVAPNRRGLPGFGQQWNDQISGDWGGQAMQDYLSAIDALKQEDYIDEDRLGAVGASFGGYSVYWLAGNHEGRFKTFISHCGLFNMQSWYGNTEEMFFANWDLKGPYWATRPNPTYLIYSPHLYVQNWDTPILVIHGGRDYRVPETEGMQAFQAAQLKGIPSRFLYFPNEGHWVLKPQNGLLWHREFFGWLDQWLK